MSQELAIIAANARPIGANMTYVWEETITVSEPLADAERLEYGQEMADPLAKIEEFEDALDAERKHYKRLIEEQDKIAQTASKHYRDGKEEREVHCDLLKDWDKCEMVWVEACEPYREILRRPMTAEERQGSFLEKPVSVSPGDDVIDVDAEEQQWVKLIPHHKAASPKTSRKSTARAAWQSSRTDSRRKPVQTAEPFTAYGNVPSATTGAGKSKRLIKSRTAQNVACNGPITI